MAKLNGYPGSIKVPSGFTQKNGEDFALMEAHAIQVDEDGTRLDEKLASLAFQSGASFKIDDTLSLSDEGVLSVNTADEAAADNTLPIKSSAVHTIVGNINVLLETI